MGSSHRSDTGRATSEGVLALNTPQDGLRSYSYELDGKPTPSLGEARHFEAVICASNWRIKVGLADGDGGGSQQRLHGVVGEHTLITVPVSGSGGGQEHGNSSTVGLELSFERLI